MMNQLLVLSGKSGMEKTTFEEANETNDEAIARPQR